ncbi:winged helix-turn-helix transcriptional regulator [Actinoallomurus rhizosphaericola]|uniref:winged helix-turn-helix transcriptional regulator n=1 Tax=Actinoallomurus rhizosphaericola TaxID=2952536 RepID=UPI0020929AE3|nr:helix-turn-helix domain-containing protein [Actinoallomurus rhizosphaericola]MCO5995469.1 helix-turn-helix transcriptional regulator [Actinoallomurus rhizosphaericola]
MSSQNFLVADCPVRPIYDDITSRWATMVLTTLMTRPHRFSELAARVGGISEKMLSQTLRRLTRDGLVRRIVTPTVPIQVTYELTALGTDLTPRLKDLVIWVEQHTDTIQAAQAAQAAYDADTPIPPAVANRR